MDGFTVEEEMWVRLGRRLRLLWIIGVVGENVVFGHCGPRVVDLMNMLFSVVEDLPVLS